MSESKYFLEPAQLSRRQLFPGVQMAAGAGEQLMLSIVDLEPQAIVEMHSHPHEQMGLLLEGELHFTIGEETKVVRPGDVWRIPGGVKHGCRAGDLPSKALDIFHPVREDYV